MEVRVVPSSYAAAPTYPAGHLPQSAVMADFNGDGKLDFAFANTPVNFFDPAISVVMGNGNGTFQAPVAYQVPSLFQNLAVDSLAVGDFNGDGKPDLAASLYGGNEIAILMNDGTGNFPVNPFTGSYQVVPVGGSPTHVLVGDFNGDGKADLIVSTDGSSSLEVFLNGGLDSNGNPIFARQADVPIDFPPLSLAAGDFDKNGHLDLAVTGGINGGLDVLMGNGDGTFQTPNLYGTINPPNAVAVGDLNGDGKPDVVVAGGPFGAVQVFPGKGDGTFSAPASYATDVRPTAVTIADLNLDGHPDVITANGDGGSVSVLVNKGNGTLKTALTYAVDAQPDSLVVGDFDRDGLPDVAVANSGADDVSILIGNGNGTLQAAPMFPAGPGRPGDIVTADMNGDGNQDLVVTNPATSTISVLLGNGDATFSPPISSSTGAGTTPNVLAVADLNGDGVPDVVTANLDGSISVLLGNGNGTFGPAVHYSTGGGDTPSAIVLADFNGDGHLDVALSNSTGGNTVSVLLGNGDGTFRPSVNYAAGSDPVDLAAVDMNVDGKLDLVVTNFTTGMITELFGNGDGTFQNPVSFSTQSLTGFEFQPTGIAAADLNRDGFPDLVVSDYTDQGLYSFFGIGNNGEFGPWYFSPTLPVSPPLPYGTPATIQLEDVNHDGYLDAVVGNSTGNTIAIALGNGNGSFQNPIVLSAGPNPLNVAIGDFNNDGLTDLAAADSIGNNVTILRALPPTDTFVLTAPSMAVPGIPFQVTLTVVTPYGLPDVHTLDNIHFTSTDPVAGLPADYAFQPVDKGTHTFTVTLQKDGLQTITVNDRFGINPAGSVKVFVPDLVHAPNADAGSQPIATVTGDFNKDGKADVAFADAGSNLITVLLGNGDGSFRTPITVSVNGGVGGLAVGDLNGDGNPDLIVTNPSSNKITALLGNGDGTFAKAGTYAAGLQPGAIITGDFNADGKLDVAVADGGANSISVLLGRGDGTFQSAITATTGVAANALVAGDFNGDNKLDLALTGETGGPEVLLGNGDGTFQAPATLPTSLSNLDGIVAADLDGAGVLDLIVASASSGLVQVFPGDGAGSFITGPTYAAGAGAGALLVANLNSYGRPDVVVANAGNGTISVLLNNGLGGFQPALTYVTDAGPAAIATADFNRDGIPDLVAANATANDYTLLFGNGEGTFKAAREFPAGSGGPFEGVAADINGDGRPDLVMSDVNSVNVLLGNGDNTFQAPVSLVTGPGSAPHGVAVADLTGSGTKDIIAADYGTNDVAVFLGNGDGTFQAAAHYAVGSHPSFVAVADLNHDGIPDLIVTNSGSNNVSVLLGNGDGTFQSAVSYTVGTEPTNLAVLDLNGDENPDIVVVNTGSNNISVLLGNGDGTFLPAAYYAAGANPSGLAIADYNKDDRPDVIVANNGSGTFSVLPGRGNGTFGASVAFTVPTMNPSDVQVADFNKDGNSDIMVASATGNTVYTFLGNGQGNFQSPIAYTTGSQPAHLVLGDFNGDGLTDVAVADAGDNYVTVLATPSPLPDALQLTPPATTQQPGVPFQFTVTALNPYGTTDALYLGTIHFTSTDPLAVLPSDYTFQSSDAGSHTFTITLYADGRPDISVQDVKGVIAPVSTAVAIESGPQIAPIPDQTMTLSQGSLLVIVPVPTDADGDIHGLNPPVVTGYSAAYDLQQQLNLYQKGGSYYQNAQKLNEKWLFSAANGNRYAILPDGEVRSYNGTSLATSPAIATLDSSYWLDPTLLTGATQPAAPAVKATLNFFFFNQLTITPPANYIGTFRVTLTASDGSLSASQSFLVTVTDNPPTLAPIADQTMSHSQGSLSVTLQAADTDLGDTVTFATPVVSGYSLAYDLQQQLGLYEYRTTAGPTYFQSPAWNNGKWLFSAVNGGRYLILPGGQLLQYVPGATSVSGLMTVATLDPSVWVNPTLLTNATAPLSPAGVTATISGNVLTVTAPSGYVGTFRVSVTASDGTLSTTQSFLVHVTDSRPVLQTIPDQTIAPGTGPVKVTLAASDPDAGDTVSFQTPTVTGSNPAYDLQRLLGLYVYQGPTGPSYFQSAAWNNGKWLFSSLTGNRYLILPSGQVLQYVSGATSVAGLTPVAQLDPSVYTNPSLLTAATAPAAPTGVTASITGNVLTVNVPPTYTGTFRVSVTATDGALQSTQSFLVNVAAGTVNDTPVLSALGDQSFDHTQEPLPTIPLGVTDNDETATVVSAQLRASGPAYDLQQRFGLYAYQGVGGPNYFQSAQWSNGKWLFSSLNGGRYLIMPSGQVLQYVAGATSPSSLPQVAQLDPSVYLDPTLITNPAALPIGVALTNTSLNLTPSASFSGSFWTTVLATDGIHLTGQPFLTTITNSAPLVGATGANPPQALPDVTIAHGSGPLTVNLATADADGDAVTLQASVAPAGPMADLQRQLGLYQFVGPTGPTYFQNAFGKNEKWLFSAVNGNRYLILPTGEVRQFIPGVTQTFAQTTHYATLDPSAWLDPTLIFAPPPLPVMATITGNMLTVTPGSHFAGSFWVTVQATDGLAQTTQRFKVTVTDATPLLGNIPNQVRPQGKPVTLPLAVSDPDGDTVKLSATVATASPAVALQQQLALYEKGGSYYFNAQGLQEKWLFSAVNGNRYAILPDGELRVYNGTSLATSTTIATLDTSYYDNPVLLTNPAAPAVTVNITGTTLTITPSSGYTGTFWVTVFATDGTRFSEQMFQVSIVPPM